MFVAAQRDNCTITQISQTYGISRNHLVVIVHKLGKLGFLRNRRGRSGGLKLAKSPHEITVGAVVRALEPLTFVDCFGPELNSCVINGACRLTTVLEEALAAWLAVLDRTTLASLVDRNRKLVQLLRLAA
jgi:Rrf2 family nitric oxide-sensitive transcriptional repressor